MSFPTSTPTQLALSRLTGRPVAASSAVALPITAAKPEAAPNVPAGLARIIRPSAQTRWILPQLSAITPQYIESVLRGAFVGGQLQQWELFDLMEDTWPRLAKNLNEIKRAVVAMDWKIEPWAEEDAPPTDSAKERSRVVSNAVWKMRPDPCGDENGFEDTLRDMLDAWGKGLSVIEIDWEIRRAGSLGDITAPRCTNWVHPTNYAWSNEGRLGLRSDMLGTDAGRYTLMDTTGRRGQAALEEFPTDKFLIAIAKAKSGSPLSAALLRPLAWWWCAANFSADWLMNLAQIFGLPFRWANYASGSAQPTIDAIASMLENMGSAGWAAFPEGTTLELKEAGNLGSMSPQGDLLDRADKQCDLLVLGQTLTSEVRDTGGALATANVHAGVKGEVIQAAANFAARVINLQLVPAILRLNYGDDEEAPEFCPEPVKAEDVKANAERDAILLTQGIEMPKDWFYQRHNIPLPQEGEEVIAGRIPPSPFGAHGGGRKEDEEPNADDEAPSPGGEGGRSPDEGGPSTDKAEPDAEAEEEPTTAKASPTVPDKLANTSARTLAESLAADLQPVGRRLAAILQINDPALMREKIVAFQGDMERLKTDIARDPAAARALEQIISASLVNGLAANKTK